MTAVLKELLPGPDWANKLVEVLTKFRENKVAFMADIDKIYFQIFVAEEHRSSLRFLWWKEENISDKPTDYEICVHVFGSVSSGVCSNYALKMAAVEKKDKLDEEAAQILQNNFYMDDLLKSLENEDMAVQLIKKVTGMCHEEGFNLTNFISNSRKGSAINPRERQTIKC